MAELTKVAETSRRGLEPVNPKLAGQYDQIVALLTRRLGPDHAFLFAEPAPLGAAAAGAADTAWYCKGTGTARPLSALPPAEAAAVQGKLAEFVHDIETLAEEMQSEGDASRELGRLLKDALVVPDAGRVWAVDGRPVLVDWGSRLQAGGSVSARGRGGLLAAIGGAGTPARSAARVPPGPPDEAARESEPAGGTNGPRPPEAPPFAPTPRRGRWLAHAALWLVFAALTLASAVRLLEACALGPLWPAFVRNLVPSECASASTNRDVLAANEAARSLDDQIRRHEIALGAKAAKCASDCRPPVQEAKKETPPPRPPKKETKVEPPRKEEAKIDPPKREEPIVLPPLKEEKKVVPVVPDRKTDVVVGPGPVVVGPTVAEIDRRVAAFDRGRVEVTLAWDGPADLDLRVTCPDRKEIFFREPSNCGGRLVSKDLGVGGGKADARQVEHVAWTGQPDPTGTYTVRAQLFKRYSETRPAIPYTVVLRLDGNIVQQQSGQLSTDGQVETAFTFNAPLSR
jgi:hypothetical protein